MTAPRPQPQPADSSIRDLLRHDPERDAALIALIDSWLLDDTEDTAEQRATFEALKLALNEDRAGGRLLFP